MRKVKSVGSIAAAGTTKSALTLLALLGSRLQDAINGFNANENTIEDKSDQNSIRINTTLKNQ